MHRLLNWFDEHLLEMGIAFLLFFIPLYPKLPLIDINQTWVYIRVEDFLVALVVGIWLIMLARKKVTLKTPLSFPIFLYWLVGGLSVLNAIFILSSSIPHFFPHLVILHYFRRLEYMILFFVTAATVKDLRVVKRYLAIMAFTLFLVCFYGFGQKFLGFPAFLTMNEEFSKGLPLYLPPTARMTSTFAGHYDLAAFLILMIAFWGSLIFGFKNWLVKIFTFGLVFLSFILLLFTASRISFMVYLISVSMMLFWQKKKWLIIPVIILSMFLSRKVTGSAERFAKTFRIQQVVYDTRTGLPIATLEDFLSRPVIPTPTPVQVAKKTVLPSVPVSVPTPVPVPVVEENLPLGTAFFSLEKLSKEEARAQIIRKPLIAKSLLVATTSAEIATISGEFLIKRAIVYDISFTTRIQGEWPRAIEAYKRNRLLGSGFSTISLATDNDYLRLLGETGLAGLVSFFAIFAVFFLIIRRGLREAASPLTRSIFIGCLAGILGLFLNAILIDVFEASKVAYTLWMMLGITVGLSKLTISSKSSLLKEAGEVIRLPITTIVVLSLVTALLFGPAINNYFIGDDFTWLRWAFSQKIQDFPQLFVDAQGFFYRPLAKLYFALGNSVFGLRPQGYHLVSILLHLGSAVGAYWLAKMITKKNLLAFLTGLFFLIHPTNAESIFWVSTTSHLFAGIFYIWGFIGYFYWRNSRFRWRMLFYPLTLLLFLLGLASHEMMITFPILIVFYDLVFRHFRKSTGWYLKILPHLPFWIILTFYLWLRNFSGAHGLSGDYNYSPKNFVFNLVGNLFGYLGELIASFHFIPIYDFTRIYLRAHKLVALVVLFVGILILRIVFKKINIKRLLVSEEFKLVIFSFGWLVIVLLPFIGLGNIAERYLHTAQLGYFLIISLLITKLFERLKKKNLYLGFSLTFIFVLLISGFYLKEMETAKKDWREAGETANRILLALPTTYIDFPPDTYLYFVNLPLRIKRAWVFPVGLPDGLWFIFRDGTLKIYQLSDLDQALDLAEEKGTKGHVFLYYENELKEIRR